MNYLYIYNIEQCAYYMKNGVYSIDCGINPKTHMVWHKFRKEDTLDVYQRWLQRSELIRQAKGK